MKCPNCNIKLKHIDTIYNKRNKTLSRFYFCTKCFFDKTISKQYKDLTEKERKFVWRNSSVAMILKGKNYK